MDARYLAEKMSDARRHLMLPHPDGESQSIADAFFECAKALPDVENSDLDDSARTWVDTIRDLMGPGGAPWTARAAGFTLDEMFRLRTAVDELAHWAQCKECGL
jgi:hypothetical protein